MVGAGGRRGGGILCHSTLCYSCFNLQQNSRDGIQSKTANPRNAQIIAMWFGFVDSINYTADTNITTIALNLLACKSEF